MHYSSSLAMGLPLLKAVKNFNLNIEPVIPDNVPEVLLNNPRVHLNFGTQRLIMNEGLQPFMLCTKKGTMVIQGQLPKNPHPQQRIFYPHAIGTTISRDSGKTWNTFPLKEGDNGVYMEGGAIQLKDGTILALETYVTPGSQPDTGEGLMYQSNDDFKTLSGPIPITFSMPGADFYGSSDDGGRPHIAMRLHRRIIELPNGDLMTTIYGYMKGDNEYSEYATKMKKTRAMLFRSGNKGRHWDYVSTIAAEKNIGTEGFGEPVLNRINKGNHLGRLICQMRTGRELYETYSDDEGKTWAKPYARVYADLDVYRTEKWAEMFKDVKRNGKLVVDNPVENIGAVVDPDLLVLRSGIVVAAFGVRIPARANWINPKHPWNGNYLAFSLDSGDTWSHVVRLTSGIFTTHYMAIEETPKDNHIFVAYDYGNWTNREARFMYGRPLAIYIKK